MAKKEGRKPLSRKRTRMLGLLLLAAAFAATCLMVLADMTPKLYDVGIGEPSPDTITAPKSISDEAATQALRDSARANAQKVYAIDDALTARYVTGAEGFFSSLYEMRASALSMLPQGAGTQMDADGWKTTLSDEQKAQLCAMTTPALDADTLAGVLASTTDEIQTLRDVVISKLSTSLEAGLSEDGTASVKSSCVREINAMTGVSATLKQVAALVLDDYMHPTLVLDEEATRTAQDAAADAVTPVMIKKGDVIAERGTTVTKEAYAILSDLGLVRADEPDAARTVGAAVLLLLVFSLFVAYLSLYRKDVLGDWKKMLIIAVLIALTVLLAFAGGQADERLSPALIAIMLCALLVDEGAALALTPLMAVTLGMMTVSGEGAFDFGAFSMCASTLAAGTAAVIALRKTQNRGALIAAGAVGGAAASFAAVALQLIGGSDAVSVLVCVAWTFGSAMIATLLVVGSLSLWEIVFDVATPARLNELGNANQPLLRELMTEAPGTYQHSVLTAALAEAAAERVGANPLLARVAAYYHDVGKLRRPLYFKENQKNGENIHDSLPPLESAQAIIAHQKDGVALLIKYKLPSAVVRICAEHHGNSLVTYFYHKAKQTDDSVQPKLFRYPGNRPSTKESAIVMLSDCCEAAVRSLGETSSEAVAQMVHRIIWSKINAEENLLAGAPLTVAEITEIEKSFLRTFSGIMHDRIEYPDVDEVKK